MDNSPSVSSSVQPSCRLRITFSKAGALRFCSHLDLARVWERTLRRAGLPLVYSHGFNPRPKLQLAAALPVGHSGQAEVLDLWLERHVPVDEAARALAGALPPGLGLGALEEVALKAPALQAQIVAAEYRVTAAWAGEPAEVEVRVAQLLALTNLPVERRGRPEDLRPLIEELRVEGAAEGRVELAMRLAARPSATARPEAVLEALGLDGTLACFERRQLLW